MPCSEGVKEKIRVKISKKYKVSMFSQLSMRLSFSLGDVAYLVSSHISLTPFERTIKQSTETMASSHENNGSLIEAAAL